MVSDRYDEEIDEILNDEQIKWKDGKKCDVPCTV
jgi:hypothetical protein